MGGSFVGTNGVDSVLTNPAADAAVKTFGESSLKFATILLKFAPMLGFKLPMPTHAQILTTYALFFMNLGRF